MVRARAGTVAAVIAIACGAVPLATSTRAAAQSEADQGAPVDVPEGDEYADTDPSALTDFRATLDPHGAWVDDPSYGTVWTPSPDEVGADFEPYVSGGRWDYADGDYVWVSDYVWGWVSFHYGRWAPSGGRWLWIPGRLYAGAWVDWRVGEGDCGYLGWAPMPPAWGWVGGGAVALGVATPEPWAVSPYGDVFSQGTATHTLTGDRAAPFLARTRPYVRARPAVPGQTLQSIMRGPPPSMLGIDVAHVPHAPVGAREQRARQFARPSTAQPLGAHAPAPHVIRPAPRPVTPRGTAPARGGGRGRR